MPAVAPPAVAHASVIVTWNTGARRAASATPAVHIFTGTLISLKGRTAGVRMADGSLRYFTADEAQLPALRERIGYSISFIVK